jgi:hypothetical protein
VHGQVSVNCTAYMLVWVCELYLFGCRQFPELLRPELLFLLLGNWVKTYHPRNVGFTEIVSIFVSKPWDEKFSYVKRKHSRKDPDEFNTSC